MADPWSKLLPTEEAAFAALLGIIQAQDQRPPQAFDPDGKPRVPASGGQNPYPFPSGSYPPNPTMLERVQSDPVGNAIMPAFGGAMNMLAATGDAMGPTGMPMSMLGRMGKAAVATPGAAVGRGPSVPFQIEKAREAIAPLAAAESRAGMAMPMPRPMPGTPPEQVLNSLLQHLGSLHSRAPAVRNALASKLEEFNANVMRAGEMPPALPYQPNSFTANREAGMVPQFNVRTQRTDQPLPFVRPEADPGRIEAARRSEEAARRGRIDMDLRASAERYSNSPPEVAKKIDDTMQKWLGSVAESAGVQPDQLARLPRGQFERFISNEPGLAMLMKHYGMTLDDIIGALGSRGYAVPPRAPFNANVMQQYQPGRSGALPMTAEEKALRDAMHRQNRLIGGAGQGDAL